MLKSLVRDWTALALAGDRAPLVCVDYAEDLRALPRADRAEARATIVKIDDAQRLARTNVSPGMVAELVRMALTGTGA